METHSGSGSLPGGPQAAAAHVASEKTRYVAYALLEGPELLHQAVVLRVGDLGPGQDVVAVVVVVDLFPKLVDPPGSVGSGSHREYKKDTIRGCSR